jgi:hypothetical protein
MDIERDVMENTWVVFLRNINFAVPSLKVLAHNLTHEAAKSQADEIYRQRIEGERVTRVYIMDGREPHEECDDLEECLACHDLILAAHREELEKFEQEMLRRGMTPFT